MERLAALRAECRQEGRAGGAQRPLEAEKAGLNHVGDLKAKLDELRSAADKAQREGDLETASRVLYGEIPPWSVKLNAAAEAESAGWPAAGPSRT